MKRYLLFLIANILIFTISCNLEMPGSVTFKGNPTIVIPGGNRSQEISALWDIEAQLDDLASGTEGLTRVATSPGDPYELEFSKEILNIAISDFASETLNFEGINQTIDPQNVVIPSLALDAQTISENITPLAVPAGMTLQPVNISEIPEVNGSPPAYAENITSIGYTSVTFDSGKLQADISITEDVVTGGLVINCLTAEILMPDDSLICATNTILPVNLVTNPTITFPLAGNTFPATFKIELTIDITNAGGFPQTFDIDAILDFSLDTTISAASGIDFDEILTSNSTIPFDPGTEFVSTIIGTGQIDVSIDFPVTWSNITSAIDISLYQNAALIATGSGAIPYTLDLAGATFTSGDLTASYTVTVTGASASFDLDPVLDEVSGDITTSITNLDTLVITPSANLDFSESIAEPIDAAILDLIASATFDNPVITTSITNDLPFNIDVSLDSPELDLDPGTANHTFINTGTEYIWNQPFLDSSTGILDMASADITGDNEINLDLVVSIPDYNPGTNELTLTNITPGTSYSLSGNVTADLTLSELVIKASTFSGTTPDTSEGEDPMDFSMLESFLPDTIDLIGLEALIDISLDSSAGDLSVYLAANYTDPDTNSPVVDDLLGTAGTPMVISTSDSITIGGLQDVINNRPSDLTFTYEVTATNTTINVTGTEENISANMNINIPLTIYSNGDSEILDEVGNPIMPAPENDLFGRSSVDENDLMYNIDSIIFHTDIVNSTGVNNRIDIEGTDFNLSIPCVTGSGKIELSNELVNAIINNVPFNPDIHLIIPDGTHSINTNPTFEISMWFELKTKIVYTIDLGGGE